MQRGQHQAVPLSPALGRVEQAGQGGEFRITRVRQSASTCRTPGRPGGPARPRIESGSVSTSSGT